MCLKIEEGAIFISDSHDNNKRDGFYRFLQKIDSKEIKTSQLFLMGDMFDLLFGGVFYTIKKHQKEIDLLNRLSKKMEIFYFEGNHDFGLKEIFPNIKVFTIESQPVLFSIKDKFILLSHGDKYGDIVHRVYTKLIRNRTILGILNFVDSVFGNFISKKLEEELGRKKICTEIESFEKIIEKKLKKYRVKEGSMIAEGHYHQNRKFRFMDIEYINFSSFACNQSYFIVQLSPDVKFTEKKVRGCDV